MLRSIHRKSGICGTRMANKLHLITYGCQMNEYDSERVAGLLRERDYELTTDEREADVILLNTCAIREKAEDKVFSKLGELKRLKAARPDLVIGVMGCMAQLHGRGHRGRDRGAGGRGLPRGDAARADGQRLRARSRAAHGPGRAVPPRERPRGPRAHPLHDLEPLQPHAHADPRHARGAQGVRVVPPAAAVGVRPHSRAHEPRLHPRALPRAGGGPARGGAGHGVLDRHHRGLSRRDRRGFRGDGRDDRARRLRQRLRLPLLAPSRHAGRGHAGPDPRRREGHAQRPAARGRAARDRRAQRASGRAYHGGAGGRHVAQEPRRAGGAHALQSRRQLRRAGAGRRRRRHPRPRHRRVAAQPARRARDAGGGRMLVEMKVRGLALDPVSNMPIIILRDDEDKRSLPIWVGIFEANAIALELEKIATPRPMTHDLIKNVLESLDVQVTRVVVTDLRENTFYAVLHLKLGTNEYTVDSRPSDAIALALRVAAPIFVEEDVFPKAGKMEVSKEGEPMKADDPEQLREWLQNIKPEDFEKYNKA